MVTEHQSPHWGEVMTMDQRRAAGWMPGSSPGMTNVEAYALPVCFRAASRWPKLCTGAHIKRR